MAGLSWTVPDDYALEVLRREVSFAEREAADTKRRGCPAAVTAYYAKRAELCAEALNVLNASATSPKLQGRAAVAPIKEKG